MSALSELTATHIDLAGDGVGEIDGLRVALRGLFGGERARVEIVHRSKHRPAAVARVVEVTQAHPLRREPPCREHESRGGRCGGCPLMSLDEVAQRQQKRDMLSAIGLEVLSVVGGASLGYRCSSKRVAFSEGGDFRLGSWARRSHEGATMTGCLVDHPLIAAAADEVEREARALGVAPYDEKTRSGDLRYVWLKTDGAEVLLTLISAREDSRAPELAARLSLAAGVAFSVQGESGNAIRGGAPSLLSGVSRLTAHIADVHVDVGPLGFFQPHPAMIAEAYRDLVHVEGDAPGALAWDLYAGAGVTTALLSQRFSQVVASESYPESAASLGVTPSRVEDFLAARTAERPDLIVANPPRRGLGGSVCSALARSGAPRIHIMSCGPEGLCRDIEALRAAGGYLLESLAAYDTLPQTPHVELVAKLAKQA